MSKSDEAMMMEIKALVAASKGSGKKRKDPNSPYLADLVKQLPAEYMVDNDPAELHRKREARIRRAAAKKQKPTDPDHMLNFYAAQQRKDHGLEREVVDAKALTLPYGDTMMKINEFVELDKTLRSNTLSFDHYNSNYVAGNPPLAPKVKRNQATKSKTLDSKISDDALLEQVLRAYDREHGDQSPLAEGPLVAQDRTYSSRFHRKYPRLCSTFHFTDADIDKEGVKRRSDYWVAHFLEECFDQAYIACNTPVSKEIKWRLRNGLDLGSIDCFPNVVARLLGAKYSVMEIRKNICIEFLLCLEQLLAVSEQSRVSDLPASATAVQDMGEDVYDGERAQLFAKFLSEEYDLDFLAMFLQVRESLQTAFRFRLRDLNQVRVWVDGKNEYMIEKEKELQKTQHTYYRVQQLGRTLGRPATPPSSPSKTSTAPSSPSKAHGEKRKFAWSAEAMSLTVKLDARINRRRGREAGSKGGDSGRNSLRSSFDAPVRLSSDKSRSSTGVSDSKTATLKRSATASSFVNVDVSAPPTGKRGRTATDYGNDIGTMGNVAAEQNISASEYGKKVVPVLLPNNWHFLHDLTMPEAPIVGFETGIVSLVCMHLLPRCAQSVRTYLTDRILTATRDSLMDTASALRDLASDSSVIDATGRVSVSTARESYAAGKAVRKIPLYILFKALCNEWKKLSLEAKVSFIETGAGSASLQSLNEIYKDNNELRHRLEAEILDTQRQFGASEACVLGLEKTFRRLERRRLAVIATTEEIAEIEEARIQLDAEKMNRLALQAKEATLLQRQKDLQEKIDVLWRKATLNSLPVVVDKRRTKFRAKLKQSIAEVAAEKKALTPEEELALRHSDWKAVVGGWLVRVISTNLDEDLAMKRSALNKIEKDRQDRELARKEAEARRAAEVEEEEKRLQAQEATGLYTPGPTQRFFILEVLAKVVVRTALRDGMRRAVLKEFLRRQEHKLLLVYGSSEYKRRDRERLQREKEEMDQRQRYLLRVQAARLMSGGIVSETLDEAKARAEVLLFDPWTLLDLNPSSWLSPLIIHQVEHMFERAVAANNGVQKGRVFHFIKRGYGMKRLKNKLDQRIYKLAFKSMFRDLLAAKHRDRCARKIQRAVRCFCSRQRCVKFMAHQQQVFNRAEVYEKAKIGSKLLKFLQFWRNKCSLKYRYKSTIAALTERRFMLTWFIWKHEFKKHKFSRIVLTARQLHCCLSLQCAIRSFLARRELRRRRARKCIGALARRYFARRRVHSERVRERRLEDFGNCVTILHCDKEARRHLKAWRIMRNLILGAWHLQRARDCDRMRRRFAKWLNLAQYRTKRLGRRVLKIQSVVRMWLTNKYVLHYYRWRRGLVGFQSVFRRRLCVRQFDYDIYFYRAAKRIQKLFRGYHCRIHMIDQRILDVHYAASHNNYDRLKHYVDKYPELVTTIDAEGNNALHNAAKNACKRTLKLLMKHKFMNPNVRNAAGYTALHLTIASVAPARDECFMYMMERGFSDEVNGPDGKTTLLIAAENGRTVIFHHLLFEEDHNANIPDSNGTTCLQTACWQGNVAMVKDLIECEADVNMAGYNGTFPLHDCVYSGSKEIAEMLLAQGAYINVFEPYSYQTPLMYACSAGKGDIARLYLIHNAEVNAKDVKGQTAVHHGVASNSADVYNALREADADFEAQDLEGNCPMHLAAEAGAEEFAISMLHGGAYPSWQNSRGDQPAHIAARYNQLQLLKQICRYDEHIGRMNYEHQTPLGVAKFYLSKDCQMFLTKHYRLVEVENGRNKVGELWWDKDIDDKVGDWEVSVSAAGERFFINRKTGEVSTQPPSLAVKDLRKAVKKAELPMHRNVTIVKEENTLTKHQYYLDFAEKEKDVADISRDYINATIIVKYARRKCAYLELARLKAHKRRNKALTRFIKRHLPGFMRWRHLLYTRAVIRVQAAWRGYWLRRVYYAYPDGEYYHRRQAKAHWRLRYKLWAMWCFYQRRVEFKAMRLKKNQPATLHDWQEILDEARKPKRKVGMFEEYLYPGTHNIFFYRHSLTGVCMFQKPKKMKFLDEQAQIERQQVKKFGATIRQINLATRLQALWRGYQVRTYSRYVARAMQISVHAESRYLGNPDVDSNLYNYALHCFVGLQDIARARRAFVESLRRMQWRGPDLPFVIYSYCIFALVARDEAYMDVMLLLDRARVAEQELDAIKRKKLGAVDNPNPAEGSFRFGKSYDLANTGFFRHLAVQSHNSFGWEAYAICRFLVYRDFNSSFDAFMDAFRFAPEDKALMDNFNTMMIHFHGQSKKRRDEVVTERMQHLAQLDADKQEVFRQRREYAQMRANAARTIQMWFKKCKENRIYEAFMDGVRTIIRRRQRAVSRASTPGPPPGRPRGAGSNQGTPHSTTRRSVKASPESSRGGSRMGDERRPPPLLPRGSSPQSQRFPSR